MLEILMPSILKNDNKYLNSYLEITNAIMNAYNNLEKTKIELKKIEKSRKKYFLLAALVPIYDNIEKIKEYLKCFDFDKENEENAFLILKIIYLLKNGASKEIIKKYIDRRYSEEIEISLTLFFENDNLDIILEKSLEYSIEISIITSTFAMYYYNINKEIKENIITKLDDYTISFYNHYLESLNILKKDKLEAFKFFNDNIEFFEKKEKVKWLATNNRRTKLFYPDYGNEIEKLINFIYRDDVIDKNYKETIDKLNLKKFEKENYNILEIRAILTSIIRRERFIVGNISKYIENGVILKLLKEYQKLI